MNMIFPPSHPLSGAKTRKRTKLQVWAAAPRNYIHILPPLLSTQLNNSIRSNQTKPKQLKPAQTNSNQPLRSFLSFLSFPWPQPEPHSCMHIFILTLQRGIFHDYEWRVYLLTVYVQIQTGKTWGGLWVIEGWVVSDEWWVMSGEWWVVKVRELKCWYWRIEGLLLLLATLSLSLSWVVSWGITAILCHAMLRQGMEW